MRELTIDDLDLEETPQGVSFTLTPEQEAICEAGLSTGTSLMIEAMAGCSKTTTLEALSRRMPVRPSAAIFFNKKNRIEGEKKFLDPESKLSFLGKPAHHFNFFTANALGHGAWSRAIGKRLILDEKKIQKLAKECIKEAKLDLTSEEYHSLITLVRRARISGLVPSSFQPKGLVPDTWDGWESISDLDLTEEMVYYAKQILTLSIKQAYSGLIDYDDQIYMSALFGGVFTRYEVLFVDEAQDLSPLNHLQVKKSAADRLVIVGDPRQAIYAFRGADSSSMASIRSLREKWIDLPLSTTFRCPKAVVARQQAHAPGFSAHESNIEGEIRDLRGKPWNIGSLPRGQLAFLCRNNAPLIVMALRFIRAGEGCSIQGHEIGKSLVSLSKKIISGDDISIPECISRIRQWADHESALARANNKEEKVAIIEDKAECLIAVCENISQEAKSYHLRLALEKLFSQENLRIILSSGHKAKGLEWPNVIHLDSWRIPSKMALPGTPAYEQEMNLRYVIETRTQEILILANVEDFNAT